MSGETWTEYAIEVAPGVMSCTYTSRERADRWREALGGTVVGRTVTASDWLPVQDQP